MTRLSLLFLALLLPRTALAWTDLDGDGFAPPSAGGLDCNDTDPSIRPGQYEVCDGVDNDCDTVIDEPDPSGMGFVYPDNDGDSYGDGQYGMRGCAGDGYVGNGSDCDDADPGVSPEAVDTCGDGIDQNCDGADAGQAYAIDADGDGYGAWDGAYHCEVPANVVDNWGDCDDADPGVSPGAVDTCGDSIDQNCDGWAYEGEAFAIDADGDGYGAWDGAYHCEAPADAADNWSDCDDGNPDISPDAEDICYNDVDEDCDGWTAQDDWWVADLDLDGWAGQDIWGTFGGADWTYTCDPGAGWAHWWINGDCDESDPSVNPAAEDVCQNGIDDNCDGWDNEGSYFAADVDGDGWGATDGAYSCEQPEGTVDNGADCDDADALVYPGAVEECNGIDDDCDGQADWGDLGLLDPDGDGWGDWNWTWITCDQAGWVNWWMYGDCDESDPSVNPGAEDICQNGIDENCDDLDYTYVGWFYEDADYDGFGAGNGLWLSSCEIDGYVDNAEDCDDTDARVPTIHDCADPYNGGTLSGRWTDTRWVSVSGGRWSDDYCSLYRWEVWALERRSHAVFNPAETGSPGAPSELSNGSIFLQKRIRCGGESGYILSGPARDLRINGAGATTHLTGTFDLRSGGYWGSVAAYEVDLTWSSTGPPTQRTESDIVYDFEDWWYRYSYSGTGRVGTVSGTVGDIELTDLTGGYASSGSDGSVLFWMP